MAASLEKVKAVSYRTQHRFEIASVSFMLCAQLNWYNMKSACHDTKSIVLTQTNHNIVCFCTNWTGNNLRGSRWHCSSSVLKQRKITHDEGRRVSSPLYKCFTVVPRCSEEAATDDDLCSQCQVSVSRRVTGGVMWHAATAVASMRVSICAVSSHVHCALL